MATANNHAKGALPTTKRASAGSAKPPARAGRTGEREGSNSALARGLIIVDTILNASQPLTLTEIAAQTQLDQSTAMRLLRTLEESGYVLRTRDNKRYIGSPKALMPMPLMHPMKQLRREADSILRELSAKIRETVVLALFIDQERIAIDIAQSPGSLAPYYTTWLKGDWHASGSGKALLLSMEEARWKEILGPGPYRTTTPNTITTQEQLERDLQNARERGYVISRDERHIGLTAISANVVTWNNRTLGALIMTGRSSSMDAQRIASIGEELRRYADLMRYQIPCMNAVADYLDSPRNGTAVDLLDYPT